MWEKIRKIKAIKSNDKLKTICEKEGNETTKMDSTIDKKKTMTGDDEVKQVEEYTKISKKDKI